MTGESAALPSLLDGCPHTVTCGRHAASPTRRFQVPASQFGALRTTRTLGCLHSVLRTSPSRVSQRAEHPGRRRRTGFERASPLSRESADCERLYADGGCHDRYLRQIRYCRSASCEVPYSPTRLARRRTIPRGRCAPHEAQHRRARSTDRPALVYPSEVRLRSATPSVFHQRRFGRGAAIIAQ
jgi:hypothetical protein